MCNDADIITDGQGLINLRRSCIAGQVCCVHPTTTSSPTPAPLTGCGVGNAALMESNGFRSGPLSVKITTDSTIAAVGEFPWMVAILESGTGRFICGGSLVDERVVLTAAHCVAGRAPSTLIARLGEWDASTDTEYYKSQDLTTSSVIVHPDYYPPGVFNDIALLILSALADISQPHVGVSCIPDASDTFILDGCTVIGWGKETFNSPGISAVLRKTRVPLVDHPTCQTKLQNAKLGSRFRLHESFLCAGGQVDQLSLT
jgi:kallikrein